MWNSIAADGVMLIHFLFIAFALLGSFLVWWKRWIAWLHVPALAWGAWIEASGKICPLTPLENHFRELAGQTTYGEGFITHYLGPIIYPSGLTRTTQFVLLGVLIGVNALGYGLVWYRAGTGKITRAADPSAARSADASRSPRRMP